MGTGCNSSSKLFEFNRKFIYEYQIGTKLSEETKLKMFSPKSEETRLKMSLAQLGNTKGKFIWITDGDITKTIPLAKDIPTGWTRGHLNLHIKNYGKQ